MWMLVDADTEEVDDFGDVEMYPRIDWFENKIAQLKNSKVEELEENDMQDEWHGFFVIIKVPKTFKLNHELVENWIEIVEKHAVASYKIEVRQFVIGRLDHYEYGIKNTVRYFDGRKI